MSERPFMRRRVRDVVLDGGLSDAEVDMADGPGRTGARAVEVLWSDSTTAGSTERLVVEGLHARRPSLTGVRLVRSCPSCGSDRHGRPILTGVATAALPHVSISRAGSVTVIALCDDGPVGVDVEPIAAASFDGFASVALHPRERASSDAERTVTWVRKESLVKATGQGLSVDFAKVRVSDPATPPALIEWAAPDPPALPVWMYDVQTAQGHVTSVTVLATCRPTLDVSRGERAAEAP